jgi:hypothetical protein
VPRIHEMQLFSIVVVCIIVNLQLLDCIDIAGTRLSSKISHTRTDLTA